jgi:hypothetical protein
VASARRRADDGSKQRLRVVPFVVVVLAGQALANLDNANVNVATPAIGATLLVPSARVGAIAGQRRTFCIGMTLFTAASLACGLRIALATVAGIGGTPLLGTLYLAFARDPQAAFAIVCATFAVTAAIGGASAIA